MSKSSWKKCKNFQKREAIARSGSSRVVFKCLSTCSRVSGSSTSLCCASSLPVTSVALSQLRALAAAASSPCIPTKRLPSSPLSYARDKRAVVWRDKEGEGEGGREKEGEGEGEREREEKEEESKLSILKREVQFAFAWRRRSPVHWRGRASPPPPRELLHYDKN